jgi:hypothetical protein
MKLILIIAACSTALLCGAALAQPDPLAELYGNTIVETRADGLGAKLHFNKDGSFEVINADRTMKGTYTKNEKNEICLTMTPPPGAAPRAGAAPAESHCAPLPLKMGASTEQAGPGPNGQKSKFELVAGR